MPASSQWFRCLVGALVLSLVAGCGGDDDEGVTDPSAPVRPAGAAPLPELAAIRANNVVLIRADGQELRRLTSVQPSSSPPLVHASVSGDARDIVYSGVPTAATPQAIPTPVARAVTRSGSQRGEVVTGYLATVSRDGGRLAFVRRDEFSIRPQLVIRQLDTGAERVLNPSPATTTFRLPVALSWSSDARRLAVSFAPGPAPEQAGFSVIIDPDTAFYYDTGLDISDPRQPTTWRGWASFLDNGSVFAVQACCRGSAGREYQASTLVVVDPASKAVVRTIAVAAADTPRTHLSASGDGHFFSWISGSSLNISEDGGPPVVAGDGFVTAAILPPA